VKLILLNKDSNEEVDYLLSALVKFQKEVYPNSMTIVDVDSFINCHYAIYLVIDDTEEYVGFTSFVVNNYYSLREPTVGNAFLFIEKSHRRSRAMHLVSIQAGKICLELGYPLEHYIADGSGSEKFVGRLNGKKIYTTYEFELDEVKRETDRLISKVSIKDNK